MSVVDFKEVRGRTGRIGIQSTRNFVAWSDSTGDNEYVIRRFRQCPNVWSHHPDRTRFRDYYVKSGDDIEIEQDSDVWNLWRITVTYRRLEAGEEPEQEQTSDDAGEFEEPDFSPHVSVDFEDFSAPLDLALNIEGNYESQNPAGTGAYPVVNSALEPYETPPEVFKQNAVIRVTRNLGLRSKLWKQALDLRNTVNTDRFTYRSGTFVLPVEAGQSRIKIRRGEVEEYKKRSGRTSKYANLEVQFIVKKETWYVDILDFGTVYLSTAGKTIAERQTDNDWGLAVSTDQIPIKDDEGNRIQGLLDGSGEQLSNGDNSEFNRYKGYLEKKHSSFFKSLTRG